MAAFSDIIGVKKAAALAAKGQGKARDVMLAHAGSITERFDLWPSDVRALFAAAALELLPPVTTALELLTSRQEALLATGMQELDEVLRGGLRMGTVTEVVGPPGIGKTQFCLQLAVVAAMPVREGGAAGSTIYIDTEHRFRTERLSEIAAGRYPNVFGPGVVDVGRSVLVVVPTSCDDLLARLAALHASPPTDLRLIVLDSAAALARGDHRGAIPRAEALGRVAASLKCIAESRGLAVAVTNQVTGGEPGPDGTRELRAALGHAWHHAVNTRLVLESGGGARWVHVAKSPLAPICAFGYSIGKAGLTLLPGTATGPREARAPTIRDEGEDAQMRRRAAAALAAAEEEGPMIE